VKIVKFKGSFLTQSIQIFYRKCPILNKKKVILLTENGLFLVKMSIFDENSSILASKMLIFGEILSFLMEIVHSFL